MVSNTHREWCARCKEAYHTHFGVICSIAANCFNSVITHLHSLFYHWHLFYLRINKSWHEFNEEFNLQHHANSQVQKHGDWGVVHCIIFGYHGFETAL